MTEPAIPLEAIESPCIGVCTIGDDGLCVGCNRTEIEIANWLGYSPDQREAIMAVLADRG